MPTHPPHLHYTAEHEWLIADEPATVGITDTAQDALGDIVYVGLPRLGSTVTAGEVCGEVESTKSVSDLYSPVSGEVVEINDAADKDPSLINSDPYGAGWLFRVATTHTGPLLTAAEYEAQVSAAAG